MLSLVVVQFVWNLIGLLLAYIFFDAAPPSPPSASTLLKHTGNGRDDPCLSSLPFTSLLSSSSQIYKHTGGGTDDVNNKAIGDDCDKSGKRITLDDGMVDVDDNASKVKRDMNLCSDVSSTHQDHMPLTGNDQNSYGQYREEIIRLFSSRDYNFLFLAVSIGLATFNTVLGLLNQLVEKYDYSNFESGVFGAIMVSAGIVFSAIAGYIMDKTHAYRDLLQISFLLATLSLAFFLIMIYRYVHELDES